jgi:methylated-DNA-[protein]-cysteine S-methyltransferase
MMALICERRQARRPCGVEGPLPSLDQDLRLRQIKKGMDHFKGRRPLRERRLPAQYCGLRCAASAMMAGVPTPYATINLWNSLQLETSSNIMYYSHSYSSPIGTLVLASDGQRLVGLWIEGQKYFGDTVNEALVPDSERQEFRDASAWLDAYFLGKKPHLTDLPLAPHGTGFQSTVWRQLLKIPYGETMTYGEIARQVALDLKTASMSGQAVGGAVGRNPISIIIPCHRVVGSSGSLTGYAGGLQKKIHLLTLEGVNTTKFFLPKKGTAL